MNNVFDRIRDVGVVPVVVIENADDAVSLADALIRGGLPCAEVTFRTDAAEAAIRAAITFGQEPCGRVPNFFAVVTKDGIRRLEADE